MSIGSVTAADPRTVVETAWAAFSSKDLDTLLNSFAEDATWEIMGGDDFMSGGGTFTGKNDISTRLFPLAAQLYDLPTFSLTTRNVIVDGATVVLEFTVNSMTTAGREYYDVKYAAVFEVADGKITAIREYAHTLKAANVLYG